MSEVGESVPEPGFDASAFCSGARDATSVNAIAMSAISAPDKELLLNLLQLF
jgi:hypothetical protein